MRIAIEAKLFWRNRAGTGICARGLFGAMEEIAPQHTYSYLGAPVGHSLPVPLESGQSKIRRLVNGAKQMSWLQIGLPNLVRRQGPQVFHAPAMVGPVWQPCPSVFTVLDLALIRYPRAFDALWRWYTLATLRLALPRAAAVIAISQSTRRDVMECYGLPEERVHVVYCGYDKRLFHPIEDQETVAQAAERFELPERFILHVGTLEPRKNLPRLLRAFHYLKSERGIPHKLVVIGERGWLYDEIFRELKSLGLEQDVVFKGHVDHDDLPAIFRVSEMLVYPSLYEGFGLPPLEAMACGCPVVTSTVSSLPEVVGDAALCVDPYDERAIAEAMSILLLQPERRMALVQRGLERAGRFSWERAAAETLEIYERIALPGRLARD